MLGQKGRLSDRRGNRCLVGALDFVSGCQTIQSDTAERYLADEISPAAACNDAVGDCANSEPAFAELCPEDGIGSARLSFTGTVFLILTMGVRNFAELRVIGGESPLNGNKPGFRASESGGMASAERAQRCEDGGA